MPTPSARLVWLRELAAANGSAFTFRRACNVRLSTQSFHESAPVHLFCWLVSVVLARAGGCSRQSTPAHHGCFRGASHRPRARAERHPQEAHTPAQARHGPAAGPAVQPAHLCLPHFRCVLRGHAWISAPRCRLARARKACAGPFAPWRPVHIPSWCNLVGGYAWCSWAWFEMPAVAPRAPCWCGDHSAMPAPTATTWLLLPSQCAGTARRSPRLPPPCK